MKTKLNMRNTANGELAPVHWIGTDEDGRDVYASAEGWELVGVEDTDWEYDESGNYVVAN